MHRVVMFVLAALVAAALVPSPAAAQMPAYTTGIGAPRSTGTVTLEVTIVVNGKPVTKTVTIPSGVIMPYTNPNCAAGVSNDDCRTALLDRMSTASQAKAQAYADAVNKAFANEFKQLGQMATVGTQFSRPQNITIRNSFGVPFTAKSTYVLGNLTIPGVTDASKVVWKENGVMGEGGNSGKIIKTMPSPGSTGSLERADPGIQTVATGVDAFGDPSDVEFGIEGVFVADVMPVVGTTDDAVLQALVNQLNDNSIAATFDPTDNEAFLDAPLPDDEVLAWGNDDTGLNFTSVQTGLDFAVPEPPSWIYLLPALGVLLLLRDSCPNRRARAKFGEGLAA